MIELKIIRLFVFSMLMFGSVLESTAQSIDAEKIYIHFDKPYYSAGETVWFKSYLLNNGYPSQLSYNFYLLLEDGAGNPIEEFRFPVSGSTANGSISLDEGLIPGTYKLRAFTKGSANTSPSFYYKKNLVILNPSLKNTDTVPTSAIALQFFPESGHLIDRIKSVVAFKAINEKGIPVEVDGIINDDSGVAITTFSSLHDGMGKASFTPRFGQKLYASIIHNGQQLRFPLPEVKRFGVNLKIADIKTGKRFELTRSKNESQLFDTVILMAKFANEIVFNEKITFGIQNQLAGSIGTKDLPSGILHFILLNRDSIPIAERLTFVYNQEYISPTNLISILRDSANRALNRYTIKFSDSIQKTFSISITDAELTQFPDKENIVSRLLLSSDLKGYIYNPSYYFEQTDSSTREALDNVMLTHGWTRFNWDRESSVVAFNKNHNDPYLIKISGTALDSRNREPLSDGILNLQLTAEDSSLLMFDLAVNKDGKFAIDSLLFYGDAKLYFTYTNKGKKIPVIVKIDTGNNFRFPITNSRSEIQFSKPAPLQSDSIEPQISFGGLSFEGKYKDLNLITVKSKTVRPGDKINEKYATSVFRTSGKLILDNINNPYNDRSLSVLDYILNNIRTVDISRDEGILVNRKNFSLQTKRNWKIELLVDENASNVTNVRSITMDKVALIKFYEAGFLGVSSETPGGAVAVYLKKIDDSQAPASSKNYNFISYKGFSITRDFYHPQYNAKTQYQEKGDTRSTLYWNTVIGSGNYTFSFYNNDFSRKFNIVIEGFDANGKLIQLSRTNQ